ncbi:hypothetical protein A9Q99_11255 [Gammaproteobacteria bacterium 45_16_T64]|nr:hypothetical protein A9Q99_11255 [Gammaproteobacteria bacterium 45_16_T64]
MSSFENLAPDQNTDQKLHFTDLVAMQRRACRVFAQNPLYGTKIDNSFVWTTFGDFGHSVEQLRSGLLSFGIKKGDAVGIISGNRLEWAVAAYAIYGLGGVCVPLYETQTPSEWEYILDDASVKMVFVASCDIYRKVSAMEKDKTYEGKVVPFARVDNAKYSYQSLIDLGKNNPAEMAVIDPKAPAGMIYTSGTTGNPKGVVHSHDNLMYMINTFGDSSEIRGTDRSLSFLPWAHIFGQIAEVHLLFQAGNSAALVADVNDLLDDLQTIQPTYLYAVPRVYNKIYDNVLGKMQAQPSVIQSLFSSGMDAAWKKRQGGALSLKEKLMLMGAEKLLFTKIKQLLGGKLTNALTGASALNPEIIKFMLSLGIDVAEGYGASETSGALTLSGWSRPFKLGSVGQAIPGTRLVIDHNIDCGTDVEGEIIGYSPANMLHYHNNEALTKTVFTEDGGYRTGDLGRIDDEGFLFVTGRVKEQYKLENGKFVSPVKIEEQLKLKPYVSQAMLHGINRPYNIMIVSLDVGLMQERIENAEINCPQEQWNTNPVIRQLIEADIEEACVSAKGYEKPRNFVIVLDEWTTETGILTPTMKLKRRSVLEKYQAVIDELYS